MYHIPMTSWKDDDDTQGSSQAQIDALLGLSKGKGAMFIDLEVPVSSLVVPPNGPTTVPGGAWQRILTQPIPIGDARFVPFFYW